MTLSFRFVVIVVLAHLFITLLCRRIVFVVVDSAKRISIQTLSCVALSVPPMTWLNATGFGPRVQNLSPKFHENVGTNKSL